MRQAEARLSKMQTKAPLSESAPKIKDIHLQVLLEKLQEKLGTKVSFFGSIKRGRISIDFYGPDDLCRIIDNLKLEL